VKILFDNQKTWDRFEKILASWKGTPYRHLWKAKKRGVDCTLFTAAVMVELGYLKKIEHDYYPRDWHIHTKKELVMEGFFHHMINNLKPGWTALWLPTSAALIRGDIVAFRTMDTGVTNHCGIVIDRPKLTMIHSIELRGVSEMRLGNWWRRRLRSVFRFVREE